MASPDALLVVQIGGVQAASGTAQPKRGSLGEGAARAAPTAPHATAPVERRPPNGPERFWSHWSARVALAVCLVLSSAGHCSMMPFGVPTGFELRDVEGDAVIAVDVFAVDDKGSAELVAAPPPENEPPQPESSEVENPEQPQRTEVPRLRDAGADAADAAKDARPDAPKDSSDDGLRPEPLQPRPSSQERGELDGAVASADRAEAGSGANRDPEALIGSEAIRADVPLVTLVVNAEVIRRHPVGARLGYLLRGVPQWDEFMSGTDIDPVRDTDWVLISGPSLINTARDSVLIHYSAPDSVVDRAVRTVGSKYDRGGPFDAGVRGVKATLIHADRAERVILRPQSRLLAVVPPNVAEKNARALLGAHLSDHIHPGEAVYLRLVNPHHPMPELPESIIEMQLRVVPRSDDGADVFIEGITSDAASAAQAAEVVGRVIRRHNDVFVSLLSHGLLDHVDVTAQDAKVNVHLTATRDQIEALANVVGQYLGVEPGTPSTPTPTSTSTPTRTRRPTPAMPSPPSPSQPRVPR